MIKHIVMWKLKDKERNALALKSMIENLRGKIPQIREVEAGVNFNRSGNAFDVALYSVFESADALAAYQKHPDHLAVADFLREIATDRCVVDYEV